MTIWHLVILLRHLWILRVLRLHIRLLRHTLFLRVGVYRRGGRHLIMLRRRPLLVRIDLRLHLAILLLLLRLLCIYVTASRSTTLVKLLYLLTLLRISELRLCRISELGLGRYRRLGRGGFGGFSGDGELFIKSPAQAFHLLFELLNLHLGLGQGGKHRGNAIHPIAYLVEPVQIEMVNSASLP